MELTKSALGLNLIACGIGVFAVPNRPERPVALHGMR